MHVILNAGWSLSKDNWEEMLEISGVAAIRTQYWEAYNTKKDQIIVRDLEILNQDFLQSAMFNEEERKVVMEQLNGGDLSTVKAKVHMKIPTKKPEVPEEFIVSSISNELVAVL